MRLFARSFEAGLHRTAAFCPRTLANDAKQWVEAIQEYANITELDAATLNRLIKEIVVHERIDEDKTRHMSIEMHFNL